AARETQKITTAAITAGTLPAADPLDALAQPFAPVRKVRRPGTLAPQHGVRRPRRGATKLLGRDPPDATVEPRLLEDRFRKLRPRAGAVRRDMPDAGGKLEQLAYRGRE